MSNGLTTATLDPASSISEVIGNLDGKTVRIPMDMLGAMLSLSVGGPHYEAYATLAADLAWGADTVGVVWGDNNEAARGVYKKSGASGAGSWARIGDLPMSVATLEALNTRATVTAMQAGDLLLAQALTSNGMIYTTVAAGVAAVADGAVFMVYIDGTLSLYRRTGGAGTLLGAFGVSQVEALLQQALDAVASVEAMAPQKDAFIADGSRNWFDIPGLYYDPAYLDVIIGGVLQPPSRYTVTPLPAQSKTRVTWLGREGRDGEFIPQNWEVIWKGQITQVIAETVPETVWCAYSGTANAIILTHGVSALVPGVSVRFQATAANTGATTINLDGLGVRSCRTVTGVALPSGYIRTDAITEAVFDGTYWVVRRQTERGSNANGEYVRLEGGMQACFQRLTDVPITTAVGALFRSDALSWTFPAAFVAGATNGAMIHGRVANANGLSVNVPYGSRTTIVSDARAYAISSVPTSEIYLSANGRWY